MSDIGSINIELDSIESSPLLARVSDSLIKCLIHSHGLSKVVHSKRVLCIVYGIHFLYMWYVSYVESNSRSLSRSVRWISMCTLMKVILEILLILIFIWFNIHSPNRKIHFASLIGCILWMSNEKEYYQFLLFCIVVNKTYRRYVHHSIWFFFFQKKVEEITVESLKKMLGMKTPLFL